MKSSAVGKDKVIGNVISGIDNLRVEQQNSQREDSFHHRCSFQAVTLGGVGKQQCCHSGFFVQHQSCLDRTILV